MVLYKLHLKSSIHMALWCLTLYQKTSCFYLPASSKFTDRVVVWESVIFGWEIHLRISRFPLLYTDNHVTVSLLWSHREQSSGNQHLLTTFLTHIDTNGCIDFLTSILWQIRCDKLLMHKAGFPVLRMTARL